jgi:hypothetical protein
VVLAGFTDDLGLYVTRDRCANWTRVALDPAQFMLAPRPFAAGPHVAFLGNTNFRGGETTNYLLDLRVPEQGVRPAGAVFWSFTGGVAEAADGTPIVLDPLGSPLRPAGWPPEPARPPGAPANPLDGTASATTARAFERLNSRYRRPIGLPDIVHVEALEAAAGWHAAYVNDRGPDTGHTETPGQPGFTGKNPGDRCFTAGWQACGEVLFAAAHGPAHAIDAWMATPFHGLPLLIWDHAGAALVGEAAVIDGARSHELSADGAVSTVPGTRIYPIGPWLATLRAATDAALAGDPLRTWPTDGMQDAPVTWYGSERPDPLEGHNGERDQVGPVLFVLGGGTGRTSRLEGPAGPIPLIEPAKPASYAGFAYTAEPARTVDATSDNAFFAARRLTPHTTYRLIVTPADQTTRTITFQTNDGSLPWRVAPTRPAPPGALPTARACRVAVRKTRIRKNRTRITLTLRRTCTRGILERRLGTRTKWKRVTGPVTVSTGRTIRWRVRVGSTIITKGTVKTRPATRPTKP